MAWKILLNRIQSKENLRRKGLLNTETETRCSFCYDVEESTSHLFFTCVISWRIWMLVYAWLGIADSTTRGWYFSFSSKLQWQLWQRQEPWSKFYLAGHNLVYLVKQKQTYL
uniref:Reverse transcriptase zinc-binding domain-containing protein n=1 Tax=Lotus japonicus TaxID=34305 RepID=I3T5B6_LOTJA|nr:unknown [Lotus japonicus]